MSDNTGLEFVIFTAVCWLCFLSVVESDSSIFSQTCTLICSFSANRYIRSTDITRENASKYQPSPDIKRCISVD